MDFLEDVLIAPVSSEKATILREANKYVFKVDPRANKYDIKQAVSKLFGVKVLGCTTSRVAGKARRTKSGYGRTSSYKKATVTIGKDEKIKIFEGV